MVPRQTVYYQWGKGRKRVLRFSKSGKQTLEDAYSRHYTWNRSQEEKQAAIDQGKPEGIQADRLSAALQGGS